MKKGKVEHIARRYSNYNIMGSYIKRFIKPYTILLCVVAIFEVLLTIREFLLPHRDPFRHWAYIGSYFILFAASVASAIFLLVQRKKTGREKLIAIVIHVYAIVAMLWGLGVSLLDYMGGGVVPVVFFTILATIGGLLILNPFVYLPSMVVLLIGMIVGMYLINSELISIGNLINIIILFIMIGVVSYRTTAVAVIEEDQREILIKIGNMDTLTGLKNENAYYRFLDDLDDRSQKESFPYAVIVMDLNGLKHVDDTYGHRFGAHLISTAGKVLPTVFKNSEIFHTGGDEFVAVIVNEFEHLDEFLKDFENNLECQTISFEGVELTLSLARGVAIHEPGEKYNDTYQRADRDMYVNKPIVKAKHNIIGR
ncbi:MAG: GGDEF domain-containing protein [Bacilli bacterium]|nr:GGDEF domain-containing protein [Bacilli bacterium]